MPDFKSAAILVWLNDDEDAPTIGTFECEDDEMPEHIGFWELGAALPMAVLHNHVDGKVAWIKVDNQVLSPNECAAAYARFKSGVDF